MSTLCETYSDAALAHEAVERKLATGTPADRITLLCGSRPHDVRREPVGRFAGQIKPTDQVGTYGNVRRQRRQGRGAFAGDPDAQRQGSFGDVERDVIVTFEGGAEHEHLATHRRLRRLLADVTLDGEPADALVGELHDGHGLVVTDEPAHDGA
jgi:hypothetical protein